MGRFPNIWRASKMLETSRCISIFAQIVATVPFYTRAYFDMGQYSINKSTIGRKWWKSDKKDPNMKIETGVIRFYLDRIIAGLRVFGAGEAAAPHQPAT